MTSIIIKLINHNFVHNNVDNDVVIYTLIIGTLGTIGFSLARQLLRKTYMDKGVQTEVPKTSEVGTQTEVPRTLEVGTQTDIKKTSEISTQTEVKKTSEISTQTEAEEPYLNSPNKIIPDDESSIETLCLDSSTSDDIDTLSDVSSSSDVTLVPRIWNRGVQTEPVNVTPINTEVIPNQILTDRVAELSNAEFLAANVDQLNAIDPFSATPWTPERVLETIENLGIINNLFN